MKDNSYNNSNKKTQLKSERMAIRGNLGSTTSSSSRVIDAPLLSMKTVDGTVKFNRFWQLRLEHNDEQTSTPVEFIKRIS